jgi:hypothetical protein
MVPWKRVWQRFGGGIVVSRTVYDWAQDVAVLPAPVFLALLEEHPRRTV